jgi:serine/threonine protein kinase
MPKTVDDFLELLERSNLLKPTEFAKARELSADASDVAQFSKILVVNKIITPWQRGHLLQGRTTFRLGNYRLITLLGRGGMGSVFLASHVVMNRKVALKFIPAKIARNPVALEGFLAEARTIASLDHVNIVRAYSVDNEGDRYYLVMEYVEGMDLQRAVEAFGPLEIEAAVDYIRQAADGLAHAHRRNMIHCDIKPSNLIVMELDGTVKILDMGLARLVQDKPGGSSPGGANNQILGSVDYLAPEQALHSDDFNHRADIYALGCTLYFLLTGQPPFPTGTLAQRIVKHQTLDPEDVTHLRPEIPESLAAICRTMMAKNPADRYQTAEEVSDALSEWQPEVPQAEKKSIAIKKIESVEDFSAVSPWEQEFGDELKTLGTAANGDAPGFPPGSSGKMPVVKSGSSPNLTKMLTGTRERLIITSCTIAVLVVFLAAAIIMAIVFGNGTKKSPAEDSSVDSTTQRLNPSDSNDVPPAPPIGDKPVDSTPTTESPNPPPNPTPENLNDAQPPIANPPPETTTQQPDTAATPPENVNPTPAPTPGAPANNDPVSNPPESNPPPEPQPLQTFLETLKAVDLPDIAQSPTGEFVPGPDVSFGKVKLEGDAKLHVELIGGDRMGKGAVYSIQEDTNAAGGQAWNITRADARAKSPTTIARLRLKDSELKFGWLHAIPANVNPLRNCGLAISAGDASHFIQFRRPKTVDPLVLDFKEGASIIHLRIDKDNLPELDKLKIVVDSVPSSFPANAIKPEVVAGSKRLVTVEFSDANYANFSIGVVCDSVKKNTLDIDAGAVFRNKAFRLAAIENKIAESNTEVEKLTRRLEKAKNNAKEPIAAQLAAAQNERQLLQGIAELGNKLNGETIHYRIILDDEKYPIEIYNTGSTSQVRDAK